MGAQPVDFSSVPRMLNSVARLWPHLERAGIVQHAQMLLDEPVAAKRFVDGVQDLWATIFEASAAPQVRQDPDVDRVSSLIEDAIARINVDHLKINPSGKSAIVKHYSSSANLQALLAMVTHIRDQQIILAKYGLGTDGREPRTRQDVADEFQIKLTRLSDLSKRALQAIGRRLAYEQVTGLSRLIGHDGTPLAALELQDRIYSGLTRAGYYTVEQLEQASNDDLLKLTIVGTSSLNSIRRVTARYRESHPLD